MTNSTRLLPSLGFTAIALFLATYNWAPARDQLQREQGVVARISPQINTWYEIEITTASGASVTCRTRRGWPLFGPERCPLEKFERIAVGSLFRSCTTANAL